jgi:putative chitinase
MLSLTQLRMVMPHLARPLAVVYLPHLRAAMQEFQITSVLQRAAFLAQGAHESGELRWLKEIWGPTPQQLRYDPPSSLARRLGNRRVGDGFRYRGRGMFQTTGLDNYIALGKALGLPLEAMPDLVSEPHVAFRAAGFYWRENGCDVFAEMGPKHFDDLTRRINGGLTGKAHRDAYYARALTVFGYTPQQQLKAS